MMTTRSVNETSIVAVRDNAMAMLKQGAWHDDGKGHRLLIRETADLRVDAGKIELIDVLAKELTDWVNAHPFR
jgi:hypothetical protein